MEAAHAKRSGGDTADQSVQDFAEAGASSAEKDVPNAETAKWLDRVVQEGDAGVQAKLNTLHRYFSCCPSPKIWFL